MESEATGRSWAVATPHVLATDAATVAFERGGNAIDAALAAAVTLTVVYPHMCGVGGDLFALVQQPAGDVVAINASGRAPAGADPAAAADAGIDGAMPAYGPHTVTVPGVVSGWDALLRQGANLRWKDAFTPAIAFAHGGFSVPSSLARTLHEEAARLGGDPGLRGTFFDDEGAPLAGSALVRQPALGTTLRTIAEEGPGTWYGGATGARFVDGLARLGVPISITDMQGHTADLGSPLRARYRDLDVLVHPPNSQGFVLQEILATIERLDIDPDPLGPDAATIAHVIRAAGRDRDRHLADPDFMRIHPSSLLDEGHIAALVDEVHDGVPGPPMGRASHHGDTVALTTADVEGRAVSLIQSLFDGFGAGMMEPGTGVVPQSRGAGFTLHPEHPNVLAPAKRPAHTLMPVVVQRDGRFEAVAGTMGGSAQPQIDAMTLIRAFDLGSSPARAVAEPRWLVGGMDPETDPAFVVAEAGVPGTVVDALQRAGYRVDTVNERDSEVGHAHLVRVRDGGLEAGSDPRSDGSAKVN
jgi:gamma-glutamyltranspeptidase